jgi:hypothetical protein
MFREEMAGVPVAETEWRRKTSARDTAAAPLHEKKQSKKAGGAVSSPREKRVTQDSNHPAGASEEKMGAKNSSKGLCEVASGGVIRGENEANGCSAVAAQTSVIMTDRECYSEGKTERLPAAPTLLSPNGEDKT